MEGDAVVTSPPLIRGRSDGRRSGSDGDDADWFSRTVFLSSSPWSLSPAWALTLSVSALSGWLLLRPLRRLPSDLRCSLLSGGLKSPESPCPETLLRYSPLEGRRERLAPAPRAVRAKSEVMLRDVFGGLWGCR